MATPTAAGRFPWQDEALWDKELLTFYQQATALRHQQEILRTGNFERLYAQDMVYAFVRRLGEQEAIVVFNANGEAMDVTLDVSGLSANQFTTVWGGETAVSAHNNTLLLHLSPRSVLVLIS